MIYVKLGNRRASSFFDPSQTKQGTSQSLSNHTQVIMVDENSSLVQKFLSSKGLAEADKKEYDAYRKSETERIEKELAKKNKTPLDASTKALKEAHGKLQDEHDEVLKTNADQAAEIAELKAKLGEADQDPEKGKGSKK